MVDCSHGKDVFGDTSGQGRGSRIRLPPPRQPLPHGGDSPIDTVPREETTTSRSHLIIPEIRFLSPCTAIRTIAMHCPPPLEGAGGGLDERPGGGGSL